MEPRVPVGVAALAAEEGASEAVLAGREMPDSECCSVLPARDPQLNSDACRGSRAPGRAQSGG